MSKNRNSRISSPNYNFHCPGASAAATAIGNTPRHPFHPLLVIFSGSGGCQGDMQLLQTFEGPNESLYCCLSLLGLLLL